MKTNNKLPEPSQIKAVFFDAGGTLFRPYPSVGELYSDTAVRYGLRTNPREIEARFHAYWMEQDGLAGRSGHSSPEAEKEWWRSLVRGVFSEVGRIDDFDVFFDELYDLFARPEAWRLFPDALPVLRQLKEKGKILGIVSNWDSRLFGICEGLGLVPYLDFILASALVGAAKPHRRIFEEALKRAGVAPEEALHVGDSLKDDVRGARAAGIHALFIDRRGGRTSQVPTISALQFLGEMFEN